jgi:hypothetical protein
MQPQKWEARPRERRVDGGRTWRRILELFGFLLFSCLYKARPNTMPQQHSAISWFGSQVLLIVWTDIKRTTWSSLSIPFVYWGRHTSTMTCLHRLVYIVLPLSTSSYLRWTPFSYLQLPQFISVSGGRLTSPKLTSTVSLTKWQGFVYICLPYLLIVHLHSVSSLPLSPAQLRYISVPSCASKISLASASFSLSQRAWGFHHYRQLLTASLTQSEPI